MKDPLLLDDRLPDAEIAIIETALAYEEVWGAYARYARPSGLDKPGIGDFSAVMVDKAQAHQALLDAVRAYRALFAEADEKLERPTGEEILQVPMGDNDADATTVKDYLVALLDRVWDEGEEFSGKRPFGSSGWHRDFDIPLIRAGFVTGALEEDEEGMVDVIEVDAAQVNKLIGRAIKALH